MAVKIKFDSTHNVIQPTFVLSNRSGKKLGSVPATDIVFDDNFNSNNELLFKVHKYNNGTEYQLWNQLVDLKLLWCKEYDLWFEINVEIEEENDITKVITGKSLGECELSQINLYGIEINTEDDIAREDYEATVLYDSSNKNASLLDRIMGKAPHYKIKHVDTSIKNIQRTFSFDGTSIYDAFQEIAKEINCIFIIDNGSNSEGKIAREISVYDLESYCLECGHREEFDGNCPKCGSNNVLKGYGNDTTIFVSTDNLAENINYSTDVESVKNCFRLEGGDDLMTATITNCNPNGSGYIWFLSDEQKKDMSEEMTEKLNEYDKTYNYYQNEYVASLNGNILKSYNELVDKYYESNKDLEKVPETVEGYSALMNAYYNTIDMYLYLNDNMMPDAAQQRTTAALQVAKLGYSSLSPVGVTDLSKCSSSTASSAVLAVAKTIIDSRYQVKVYDGILDDNKWTGYFIVTNYSNDEDTATSPYITVLINDDLQTNIEQKLKKSLSSESDDVTNIAELFDLTLSLFKSEIKKYGVVRLQSFHDSCEACLNILIEQGVANKENWKNERVNLYNLIYEPYYQKYHAIEDEIKIRESEIAIVMGIYDSDGDLKTDGLQTLIEKEKNKIQDILDFEKYLGDLWNDFIAYRREDTYSNDNFISDGLDNGELFTNALEFIETAKKEIFKSATLQHTITSTLKNLLSMKEFLPIVDYFSVGNWIRLRVDDNIYKLRLISYTIDYTTLDNISVQFSDVKIAKEGLSDSASAVEQAISMASSYNSISRQASQGKKSNQKLEDWVTKGLALTKMKIIDNADNQNITWDEHGLLCKEYLPISDDYDDKQLKIINRGLYLTDDNWLTSKAGIGDFTFYNPETGKMEEAYGVIADTLVGNLILSEKVGIYNTENSIVMDKNGLTITTDATVPGNNNKVMTVQKKTLNASGDEEIDPVMYLDGNGNLVLTGSILIQSGFDDDVNNINDLCNIDRFNENIANAVHNESSIIYSSIDEKYKEIIDAATEQLERYKADIGQYMQFNDDGLTLGAITSQFKTVIDNRGMYFKQGDTIVSYVNNNQLHIPNAVIENTLMLGKFFFNPRSNGAVSLTWQES